MKFETAKNLVKGFLIAGFACCVLAMFMQQTGSTVVSYCMGMGAAGCILMCAFFALTGLKCPWCGKRIIRNCLVVRDCPCCRRNLATGEKMKGKKRK